jgi:prophage tail gpP-like protein
MADPDTPIVDDPNFVPNEVPLRIDINKPAPKAEEQTVEQVRGEPIYVREPGPKELATLIVRGRRYSNWTSVRVEQRWEQAFPTFQFEATEHVPLPLSISGAQFVPGDVVRVLLGGHSAVYGYITERHVGYDANNHGVRLIGCGDTQDLVSSSVPLDKLNGHDGKSVTQLANDLAQHLGIQIYERGNVDQKPFENIQVLPGETPMQAIERYARMRSIVVGSESNGGLLLIGEHPATSRGYLVEGNNILRANVVVRDDKVYKKIFATGQNKGSDQSNGDPANKQVATRDGTSTRNRVLVVVADVADTQHGIQRRADMEHVFTEGSNIEAQVTVQGWFKDNNRSEDIWRAGEYYSINSPSLILYDEVLGCAGCTYEQTANGTTTTMNMVKPIHMNGRFNFRAADLEFRRKTIAEAKAAEEAARVAAAGVKAGQR